MDLWAFINQLDIVKLGMKLLQPHILDHPICQQNATKGMYAYEQLNKTP